MLNCMLLIFLLGKLTFCALTKCLSVTAATFFFLSRKCLKLQIHKTKPGFVMFDAKQNYSVHMFQPKAEVLGAIVCVL